MTCISFSQRTRLITQPACIAFFFIIFSPYITCVDAHDNRSSHSNHPHHLYHNIKSSCHQCNKLLAQLHELMRNYKKVKKDQRTKKLFEKYILLKIVGINAHFLDNHLQSAEFFVHRAHQISNILTEVVTKRLLNTDSKMETAIAETIVDKSINDESS